MENIMTWMTITLIGLTFAIDVWAIVSLFKREQKNKLWWSTIIIIVPVVGAIGYFQISRQG